MIRGLHAMFYSSQPAELRAFLRDTLGLKATTSVMAGSSSTLRRRILASIPPRGASPGPAPRTFLFTATTLPQRSASSDRAAWSSRRRSKTTATAS
jgi:hypothetical protein